MRKIRLSDTDLEFFDLEISPLEFTFFQKHKEAFRCMWKEQGKPFWTKFTITFRSFTVKHGVIKQMSCDSPKFENLLDQAFIYIHEQYVDGKETSARTFITDIARLAQNHDKFPNLDSKSFSKDPFYLRETRDLFRRFFGSPDQKSSYLKVYVLSPIYLRFGGSVCRCLKRWMEAPLLDAKDDSYWVPPSPSSSAQEKRCSKVLMCTNCLDDCGTKFFREKLCGLPEGPRYIEYWRLGDPRFNDSKNPLYNPTQERDSDWRENLSVEDFRDFLHYAKFKYGTDDDKCKECLSLLDNHKIHFCKGSECLLEKKKKKKKKKKEKTQLTENKTDEEIQQLVDHINGKVNLDVMPSSTKGGTDMGTTDDSKEKEMEEKKKKKRIFGKHSKVTDDFKYGILSGAEDLKKHNVIGGFKVVKIEDEKTLASEITIKVEALKGEEPDRKAKAKAKDETNSQNMFPLSAPLIRSKIDNLPEKMEWWEGKGWCACVLDYEVEERPLCKYPTNFTIKISGSDEDSIKRTMFKLLFYVSNRKKRPCPGWTMDDDDVVACVLPDDSSDQEGITICIQKGFRFEERLTDEERKSLQKPYDPCQPKKKKVLMTLDGKEAEMLKGEQGRETLRELLARISGDCHDNKEEKIPLHDGSTIHIAKNSPPIVDIRNTMTDVMNPAVISPDEGPLWDQMQKNPEKFELFVMVDREKEPELRKHGLKPVDLSNFKEARKKNCKFCRSSPNECNCHEYKKNFNVIHRMRNMRNTLSLDSDEITRKIVTELQNELETFDPSIRELSGSDDDDIPDLLPHEPSEVEEMPELLPVEMPEPQTAGIPKLQNGKSDEKEKIPESQTEKIVELKTGETLEPQDKNTQKLEAEDTLKSQNEDTSEQTSVETEQLENGESQEFQTVEIQKSQIEDIPEPPIEESPEVPAEETPGDNNKEMPETRTGEALDEKLTSNNEDGAPVGNGIVLNQETPENKDEQLNLSPKTFKPKIEFDMSDDTESELASSELKNGVDQNEENNRKKLGVFKFTAKGSGTDTKIPKSPVKTNPRAVKSTKSTISGTVNFSITADKIPESLNFNLAAHMPSGNPDAAQGDENSITVTAINQNGEKETSDINKVEKMEKEIVEDTRSFESEVPESKLRRCAKCDTEEPHFKAFKKCQKCKIECILNARYYCGRECQIADWTERHKREHKEHLLD